MDCRAGFPIEGFSRLLHDADMAINPIGDEREVLAHQWELADAERERKERVPPQTECPN